MARILETKKQAIEVSSLMIERFQAKKRISLNLRHELSHFSQKTEDLRRTLVDLARIEVLKSEYNPAYGSAMFIVLKSNDKLLCMVTSLWWMHQWDSLVLLFFIKTEL